MLQDTDSYEWGGTFCKDLLKYKNEPGLMQPWNISETMPLWGQTDCAASDQDPLARPSSTDADRLDLAMMREAWKGMSSWDARVQVDHLRIWRRQMRQEVWRHVSARHKMLSSQTLAVAETSKANG
jgi:hypothetical protein